MLSRDDLRPYQTVAVEHIHSLARMGLFARMGMGKTVSTLTALNDEYEIGIRYKPTLILAPKRVANSTWPNEVDKWGHLNSLEIRSITGTAKERAAALRDKNANVFTMNYENIPWILELYGNDWPFGMVVADESTRLKGFRLRQGGKRARMLGEIAHKSDSWLNLTGTPAPNGLQDLWGQTWFLDGGERLGLSYSAFTSRWFRNVSRESHYSVLEPLPHAEMEIHSRLKDICLALDPADYFDLKLHPTIVNQVRVDLPERARELYRKMERDFFIEVSGERIDAVNASSRSQKCHQLANGAVYTEEDDGNDTRPWVEVHDVKLQALENILEEAGSTPVLVVYKFKSDLARLRKAFPSGRVFDSDPQTEKDWNKGKIPLMFVQPKSAGHGSNLQDGSNILVFFSLDWNLEEHEQVIERIGQVRQIQSGYKRSVYLYFIIANDTLDDAMLSRLETKKSVGEALNDAMKRRHEHV